MELTAELERIANQCDTLQRFHESQGDEMDAQYMWGRASGLRKAIYVIRDLERKQPEEGK